MAGDREAAIYALSQAKRLQPSLTVEWVDRYHGIVRPEDRGRYIQGLRIAGLE
jgi:adenylate cyclase